jgi:hypothetical protein
MIFYKEFLQQMLNKNEIDYILWDKIMVTLNDFTVELKITDDVWKGFLEFEKAGPN